MRLMDPDLAPAHRRAIALALFTWLPLLILSVVQGVALGDLVRIPFLFDFPVSVRLLLTLSLLIAAERVIDMRTQVVVKHFIQSGLVWKNDHSAFESSVRQVFEDAELPSRRRSHRGSCHLWRRFLEVRIFRYLIDLAISRLFLGCNADAGGLVAYFCEHTDFQFILLRWLWRYLIWCWFLWRASRLDLHLVPTHPDRVAGLGFWAWPRRNTGSLFLPYHRSLHLKWTGNSVWGGLPCQLQDNHFGVCRLDPQRISGASRSFFAETFGCEEDGLLEYGTLANEYTQSFERKWIRKEAPEGEALIGSADIQSLADLANSFEIVRKMRPAPLDLMTAILPIGGSGSHPFSSPDSDGFPF